jgi:hypothetical protein
MFSSVTFAFYGAYIGLLIDAKYFGACLNHCNNTSYIKTLIRMALYIVGFYIPYFILL